VPGEDSPSQHDPTASHYPGCAVNFEQAGCPANPKTWTANGATLECPTYASLPKVNGIAAVAIAAGGSGYKVKDTGIVTGGGNDAHYIVTRVGTGSPPPPTGPVTGVQIVPVGTNPAGSNYDTTHNPHTTTKGAPQAGAGSGLKLNITKLTLERRSGGQCVSLGNSASAAGGTVVAVPSPTLDLPIGCNFTYSLAGSQTVLGEGGLVYGQDTPNPLFGIGLQSPWDATLEGNAASIAAADGNNNQTFPSLRGLADASYGEGDGMECVVTAEKNSAVPGATPNWTPIAHTTIVENQPVSTATLNTGVPQSKSASGDLIVPLPSPRTQVRLSYNYWVFQDGTLDGTNFSDIGKTPTSTTPWPFSGATTDPIGSYYCANAAASTQGARFCQGVPPNPNLNPTAPQTSVAMVARGSTPPIAFDVQPEQFLQLGAVPTNLLYQPPTQWDKVVSNQAATGNTQVDVTMGSQSGLSRGYGASTAFEAGASVGIDGVFSLDASFGMTWSSSQTNTKTQGATNTHSVLLTTNEEQSNSKGSNPFLTRLFGVNPNPVRVGPYVDRHLPWLYDEFILTPSLQVATYNLTTCGSTGNDPLNFSAPAQTGSYRRPIDGVIETVPECQGPVMSNPGYFPYADATTSATASVAQLVSCVLTPAALAAEPTSPCLLGAGLITLTPTAAKSIIMQDPFAATGLGYESVPAGAGSPGGAIDPAYFLGKPGANPVVQKQGQPSRCPTLPPPAPAPGSCSHLGTWVSPTLEAQNDLLEGGGKTTTDSWGATSTYSTDIEQAVETQFSATAKLDIPIDDVVDLGASFTFSTSSTSSQGSSLEMSYDSTTTDAAQTAWSSEADLANNDPSTSQASRTWPHDVRQYMDPRYGTIMFRNLPPGVVDVAELKVASNVVFKITGGPVTNPPTFALDTGALDVFICPHLSTSGCQVAQNQVDEFNAPPTNNGVLEGPSTNVVKSEFPASAFTVGHHYDVYVESPGGVSAPYQNFQYS
jgi:hypothetical protein